MDQQTSLIVKRPELVKIGSRSVSVLGWRNNVVERHLQDHLIGNPADKWCKIECLARTMFGRNTEANREGVRHRIPRTFRIFVKHGLFLVIQYDLSGKGHGKSTAYKLHENDDSSSEGQYAYMQLKRMFLRREITEELLASAKSLICPPTAEGS